MVAKTNVSGTWTEVNNIYGKAAGSWQLVRQAFVNVNGTWEQFHANHTFEAYSLGLQQNQTSAANRGLWMDGTQMFVCARSYNLVLFDNYGNITGTSSYDIFGSATNAGTFASALNALPGGQIYLIMTYDEPQSNDTANGMTAALTSLFGGNATIVSGSMPYRGAYMAMGKKGQAPVLEQTAGTFMNSVSNPGASSPQADEGCLDGILHYKFKIYTTETAAASPNGNFANLTAVQVGGNLVSNGTQTGSVTVSDLAW